MYPIRPLDVEELGRQFRSAQPFPHIAIENFLDEDFARRVVEAYPTSYEQARALGREFAAVNERMKVQITEADKFPEPIAELNAAVGSEEFMKTVSAITGIDNLLYDAELRGGGMHVTNATGRLDVHVDFNYLEEDQLHRRLNILIYLNPTWGEDWGGNVELWDREVKHCHASFQPILNRCVIFETSEISYHGVTPVTCPDDQFRKSFAAYYYTREAPAHWTGESHSTIFRARPDEKIRGKVLMPAERVGRGLIEGARSVRRKLRETIKGEG